MYTYISVVIIIMIIDMCIYIYIYMWILIVCNISALTNKTEKENIWQTWYYVVAKCIVVQYTCPLWRSMYCGENDMVSYFNNCMYRGENGVVLVALLCKIHILT